MVRRTATTLLILAYFASQLAALPHAHGGSDASQPFDHDERPHIHVSWFGHEEHTHDHGHLHQHRVGHDPGDEHSHATSPDHANEHHEHDSDAVYLPGEIGTPLLTQGVDSPIHLCFTSMLATPSVAPLLAISAGTVDSIFAGEYYSSQPLYLALRALRL